MARSERSEFMEAWNLMLDIYSVYVDGEFEGRIVLDSDTVDFLAFAEKFLADNDRFFGLYVAGISFDKTTRYEGTKLMIETGKLGFYATIQFVEDLLGE